MGALGLLSLCAKGDFYNGLIGGGVMTIIGIIMILKGKSRKEVAAIKEAKQIEKAKDREVKRQIKLAKQQEQAAIAAERNRIHQENSRIKFNETNFESADFYNYNLYDSAYR